MEKEAQDGGRTEKRHGQKVASREGIRCGRTKESKKESFLRKRNAEKKMRRDPEEFLKYGSGK